MERLFPRIKNYNVSVREKDGKVIFLRKLMPGGSEHSFGIHVAEIAGMPKSIVRRANEVLTQLETDNANVGVECDSPTTAASTSTASTTDAASAATAASATAPRSVGRANTSRLTSTPDMQLSFFQLDDPVLSQIRDEILGLDINNLTPVEALNKLNDIKKILRGR